MPGVNTVRGGFDSHASPPSLASRGLPAAALFLALAAVPAVGQPGDRSGGGTPSAGPSPARVTVQSMLVPGWGQASNGKWLKAPLFLGAYTGFIGWGISINQDVQDARGAGAPDSEIRTLERSRNLKYWFAGFTMLLSMVDAYVDAHLRNFDERIDAEVGCIPLGEGSLLGLRITAPVGPGGPPDPRRP